MVRDGLAGRVFADAFQSRCTGHDTCSGHCTILRDAFISAFVAPFLISYLLNGGFVSDSSLRTFFAYRDFSTSIFSLALHIHLVVVGISCLAHIMASNKENGKLFYVIVRNEDVCIFHPICQNSLTLSSSPIVSLFIQLANMVIYRTSTGHRTPTS